MTNKRMRLVCKEFASMPLCDNVAQGKEVFLRLSELKIKWGAWDVETESNQNVETEKMVKAIRAEAMGEPPFFKKVTQLREIPELAYFNIPEGYVYGALHVTLKMFKTELMGQCQVRAHARAEFYKSKGIKARVLNIRPFIPNTDKLADVEGKNDSTNSTHTVVELMEGVVVKKGVPQSARLIDDPTYCFNCPPMCIYEYAEVLAVAVYGLDDCTHVKEWTTGYHSELAL